VPEYDGELSRTGAGTSEAVSRGRWRTTGIRALVVRASGFALIAVLVGANHSNAQLVINEIDYDQEGIDSAEFIELYNPGPNTVDLDDYLIELVNGSNGSLYQIFDLPEVPLAPGGFFVICTDAVEIETCNFIVGPPFNWLQNGAPDAVALWMGGMLVDTVSYEGETSAPYTEGPVGAPADDSFAGLVAIARHPDGADTDRNDLDFSPYCSTPGLKNSDVPPPCFTDEELQIELSGACPGVATITITGGSGGGTGVLLAGRSLGNDPLTTRPCGEVESGLSEPRLVVSTPFDVNGNLVLTKTLTSSQCESPLQAIDPTTCKISEVAAW